eukprot:4761914-Pleurochrysis_carterae.AAC.1
MAPSLADRPLCIVVALLRPCRAYTAAATSELLAVSNLLVLPCGAGACTSACVAMLHANDTVQMA